MQQNKQKLNKQEPFEEVTADINDEKAIDNHLNKADEDLESQEVNESINIITTIAEVHSHDDDFAQEPSQLHMNANALTRRPESCMFNDDSMEVITLME